MSDWLSELMDKQFAKAKNQGYEPPMRIVSWERYQEAQKAIDAGATSREIELCLAGAKWPEQVKSYIAEHP